MFHIEIEGNDCVVIKTSRVLPDYKTEQKEVLRTTSPIDAFNYIRRRNLIREELARQEAEPGSVLDYSRYKIKEYWGIE